METVKGRLVAAPGHQTRFWWPSISGSGAACTLWVGDVIDIIGVEEEWSAWYRFLHPAFPDDPEKYLCIRKKDVVLVDDEVVPVWPPMDEFIYEFNKEQSERYVKSLRELGVSSKHKCHCPRVNFAWNGPGCTCGGE